ncbi:MAG: YdiY family protein [Gammaproteobacteria bacterium]
MIEHGIQEVISMKRMMIVMAAMMTGVPVFAAEGPWTSKAGLGYLSSTGNLESTSVNGTLDVGYKVGRWTHELGLLALGSQAEGVTTAERYSLGYQAKWAIHDYDYAFAGLNYDKDKISSVEQSLSETFGYGRRLIKNAVQELNAEIGVGYRQQDFVDGTDDSSAIVRLAGDYLYNISDTSNFTQTLAIEIGGDNTSTIAVSKLNTKIRDALSLVLGFTVNNNSDVPGGFEKTDTFTSVNLEYVF